MQDELRIPATACPSLPSERRLGGIAELLIGLLVGLLGSAPSSAQLARKVAEINPGPATAGTENEYFEARFVRLGERAVFPSNDGIHGTELWVTDGTSAGTALVADICPGLCSGLPRELVSAGDRVFFAADDGTHGIELWVSDGTRQGTRLVADLAPGFAHSRPLDLAVAGDRVAFAARVGDATGFEPWISDGTDVGTRSLGDLRPGPANSGPIFWEEVGGLWLFTADDGVHGNELWGTDGSPEGTSLLVDLVPGPGSGPLAINSYLLLPAYVRLADRLYFYTQDGAGGLALSATDGTAAGTVTLHPGGEQYTWYGLGVFDDRVYFSSDTAGVGELWATDGTPGGAELIASFPGWYTHHPRNLFAAGDRLLFVGRDDLHGREVWATDGTPAGTARVIDVNPGPDSSLIFTHAGFVPAGDRVLFFADDGAHGTEPWITDGTEAGSALVADLNPGEFDSVSLFVPFGGDRRLSLGERALFRAWAPATGVELYALDGGSGQLDLLEINTQTSIWLFSPFPAATVSIPRPIAALGDRVVLQADDGQTGIEPWVSDGTKAGTRPLGDLYAGPYPAYYHSYPLGFLQAEHGAVFSTWIGTTGSSLWVTDGTAEGTQPLTSTTGSTLWSRMFSTAQLDGLVLLTHDGDGGTLFATDGTSAGTRALPAATSSSRPLEGHDGWVYFGDEEPARTDGWVVEPLGEVRPGAESSAPYPLGAAGDRMLFAADDGTRGHELWAVLDSVPELELLREIRPGAAGGLSHLSSYALTGEVDAAADAGRLFFLADDGATGRELWTSDGTAPGTRLVRDIRPGPQPSDIRWLTAARGQAFFVANDGVRGRELWVSDGTPGGTRLAVDLVPGAGSSLPQWLHAVDGTVFFSAHAEDHGRELYAIDAEDLSLRRIPDIAPGPLPSSPMVPTPAGGWLWFIANDGTTGFELWRLPLTDAIFSDGFESGDTTAWSATSR